MCFSSHPNPPSQLYSPPASSPPSPTSTYSLLLLLQESRKFETEFEQFQIKNKEQKEAWAVANPEKAKQMKEDEWEEFFEDDNIRELKQIFQVRDVT